MLRRSSALFFAMMLAYACSSDDTSDTVAKATGGVAGANLGRAGTTASLTSATSGGAQTPVGGNAATNAGATSGGQSLQSSAGNHQGMAGDNPGFAGSNPSNKGGNAGLAGTVSVSGAGTTAQPIPTCSAYGQGCKVGSDCCSTLCDLTIGACVANINVCSVDGAACTTSTECCNLSCVAGHCATQHCSADGAVCQTGAECCSQSCNSGTCAPLSYACKTAGNPCTQSDQCCGGLCSAGYCALGASFCIQQGDICARDGDCCSGGCTKAANASVGTCAPPVSVPANCTGVEGSLCSDCGSCCSRLCAPYAPTGASICQPASGCRVVGELCTRDLDCCGGDPTSDLPGAGNIHCEIASGASIGRCRNATGCAPQGVICHYKNYKLCDISSARNDCCAGPGNSGVCQLDTLGVPRCNGLGTTCRQAGEQCAMAADCCNSLPCVLASDGKLRCYSPPVGTPACVPSGGTCTINGDCCPGTSCIQPLGSINGVCGTPSLPPGTGGSPGTGGASGNGGSPANGGSMNGAGAPSSGGSSGATTNGGSSDGGSANGGSVNSGTTSTTATPVCSQYGQLCGATSDCCNGVPCTNSICMFPGV